MNLISNNNQKKDNHNKYLEENIKQEVDKEEEVEYISL